jgi:hypothetical protein
VRRIGGWDYIRDADEGFAAENFVDPVLQHASDLRAKLESFAIP